MLPTSTRRAALRLTLAAAASAAVTGLGGCANNDMSNMPGMDGSSSSAAARPSTSTGTSASGTPATGPHNDADVMFASMMIPHHQQAIEMSDMILAKDSIDPKVTALARQIKIAQAPEIAQMSGWLAGWGQNPNPSMGGMGHDMGDGTMTQAEMDALGKATGTEAAKLFLAGMTQHHQGAITMAKDELANGQNPEGKQLAQTIIDAQQAEITTMSQLLEQL